MFLYYYKNKMGKVIGTTVVRLIIIVVVGFYLKFIDNNLAGQVSEWLMNQEQVALSGEVQDPVLSGVISVETKIDLMSGLNTKLEENTNLLKQISEKLGISTAVVSTGTADAIIATGNAGTMSGAKGK